MAGWWLADAGPVWRRPPLDGDVAADHVVIGGGYLGLWTAWELRAADPDATVVLLERDVCGHGPSGRNGGFVSGMWDRFDELVGVLGGAAARRVAEAAAGAVAEIGAWCDAHGVDAWFHAVPHVDVATGPGQEGSWRAAIDACAAAGHPAEYRSLSERDVAAICRSPLFGSGARAATGATVHPARLALGLRRRVIEAGVRVCEGTPVRGLDDRPGGVRVRTPRGSVRARSAVLAIGAASAGVPALRRRHAVASSHVVITAPIPEKLRAVGWTGGEALSDCRTMLHYFRTTDDGRVVFGWGGGRMGMGARRGTWLEDDPAARSHAAAALARFLPPVAAADVADGWGGPIDVSPDHLPIFGSLHATHYGFGFTGNGVGPSRLGGRILAGLARDERNADTALGLVERATPRFPPAALAFAGGMAIRAAMVRADDADERRRAPGPVTALVAGAPRRLGFHLPR